MNKKLIIIGFLSFLLFPKLSFANICPRCKGKKYIVMNPDDSSGFGLQPVYSKCKICGEMMNINGGPKHTHPCPQCNGTGTIERYNSSSSLNHSSNDEFMVTDQISAEAYIAVHGPQLSIEEQRILQRFRASGDSNVPNFNKWYGKLVTQYMIWRDDLDIYKSYRNCSDNAQLQHIVNAATTFYNELNSIHFTIPSDMGPVVNSLCKQIDSTWKTLLERLQYAIKVNGSQRQLEYYQMYPDQLPKGETINVYVGG